MKHLLLFAVLLTLAVAPILRAQSTSSAPTTDPLVGTWRWDVSHNPSTTVEILADGTTKSAKGQTGEWLLRRAAAQPQRYILIWNDGRYVDTITLSADGQTISGHNSAESIKAERITSTSSTPNYFGTK